MTTDNTTHTFDPYAPVGNGQPPRYAAAPMPENLAAAVGPGIHPTAIPEGRHMAPTAPLSPSEFLMSLNGFDEIAIAARFGTTLGALRREDEITAGRALAFVHFRRCGQNDVDAHQAALMLTLREVVEFFPPEPTAEDAEGNAARAT